MGFFDKIKQAFTANKDKDKYLFALKKSKESIFAKISKKLFFQVDEDFLEQLMEILLEADLGFKTAQKIIERLEDKAKSLKINDIKTLKQVLVEIMADLYGEVQVELNLNDDINVISLVGVNGAGKSTTCAKLANLFKDQFKVMIIAADTFRSAAVEQIDLWSRQVGVYCYKDESKKDPSAVIVDGLRYAKEHQYNLVIIDSAGRLQNKVNLMQELAKMNRVIEKELDHSSNETLLVLDAGNGTNSIIQAEKFMEAAKVSGIVLTKLDGTAKGAIVIAIKDVLKIDVKYIGLGEQVDDIKVFDLNTFLYSIADLDNES